MVVCGICLARLAVSYARVCRPVECVWYVRCFQGLDDLDGPR